MSAMKRLFQVMADKKASDIFLSVGAPINIKINGIAVPVNQTIMTSDTVRQLLYEVLTERQAREYEEDMELNTAVALEGIGAFRISAFRQKGSPAVVVRYIPGSIPPLDSLGLPEVLKEVIMQKRGLILMVGATGAGKSTSLAAMLDFRDEPTMSMALAYAQSGHLCLATLHANNSYHAMNRIINFYSLENRPSLLLDLAAALQAVISQRLVRTKAGTRVVAAEVLLNTRHIAELIEKGEISDVKEALEKSMAPGSQTFEQSLFKLFIDGKITQDEAMANADSATNMLWLINQATAGEITGQATGAPSAGKGAAPGEKKEGLLSAGAGASFGNLKIDANA